MRKTVTPCLLSLLATGLMWSHAQAETHTFSGKVTDVLTGNGLEDLAVTVGGQNDHTDVNGDYTVTGASRSKERH